MNKEEIIAQVLKGFPLMDVRVLQKQISKKLYLEKAISRALEIQQKEHERICNELEDSLMRQIQQLEIKLGLKSNKEWK